MGEPFCRYVWPQLIGHRHVCALPAGHAEPHECLCGQLWHVTRPGPLLCAGRTTSWIHVRGLAEPDQPELSGLEVPRG